MPRQIIAPKPVSSSVVYVWDFTSLLLPGDTISAVSSVVASVYSGTDASPSNIISGAAYFTTPKVYQLIQTGVIGVTYEIKVTVTTGASGTLVLTSYLTIIPDLQ